MKTDSALILQKKKHSLQFKISINFKPIVLRFKINQICKKFLRKLWWCTWSIVLEQSEIFQSFSFQEVFDAPYCIRENETKTKKHFLYIPWIVSLLSGALEYRERSSELHSKSLPLLTTVKSWPWDPWLTTGRCLWWCVICDCCIQ